MRTTTARCAGTAGWPAGGCRSAWPRTGPDYKAGDTQRLDLVCADTARAAEFFRPGTFDLLVTDAPYGVRHGSRTAARGLARGPLDLLAGAIDGWAALVRGGGAAGIAWNTLVARREEAERILAGAGLEVQDSGPYLAFRHRVDQAITRDILIARKPVTRRPRAGLMT